MFSQLLEAASELYTATVDDEPLPTPKRPEEDDFLDCGESSSGNGSSLHAADPSTELEKEILQCRRTA